MDETLRTVDRQKVLFLCILIINIGLKVSTEPLSTSESWMLFSVRADGQVSQSEGNGKTQWL